MKQVVKQCKTKNSQHCHETENPVCQTITLTKFLTCVHILWLHLQTDNLSFCLDRLPLQKRLLWYVSLAPLSSAKQQPEQPTYHTPRPLVHCTGTGPTYMGGASASSRNDGWHIPKIGSFCNQLKMCHDVSCVMIP